MKNLILALLLLFLTPPLIYAQEPTPAPGGGGITVEPDPLPYTFEVIEYEENTTPIANLNLFGDPYLVNLMGSTVLTLFSLVDTENVLPIIVILGLAAVLLMRIYKFTTTSTPDSSNVDLSFISTDPPVEQEKYEIQRRYFSNPYRVYKQRLVKRRD